MQVVLFLVACCYFAFGKNSQTPKLMKEDLPYIACGVCNRTAESIFNVLFTNEKRIRINEARIEEVLENVCQPEAEIGKWIRHLDIVEKQKFLQLESPGGISKCENECTTISKSCELLIKEEFEMDDIILFVWKNKEKLANKGLSVLKQYLCTGGSKRCSKPKKEYSRSNRVNEVFKAMSTKDIEVEELMAKMKASGMPGMKMYDRESMMDRMMDEYGLDEDELEAYASANEKGEDEL